MAKKISLPKFDLTNNIRTLRFHANEMTQQELADKVFVTSDLNADEIVYEIVGADEIRIQSTGLPAVEGKVKIEVYP